MGKADNKTIIRRYIQEIFNTGEISNIREFVSEGYEEVYEGARYMIGVEGAINHVLGVRRVFPDLVLTIENQISEGDWIATTLSATGTFTKEWFGMKPTGKPITFTAVDVDRIRNGKIIEHGGAVNMMEPLLKAGVIEKVK